ncbi:pentapeptide repeat-containing protein [Microbispora rosea]|nr:pentapeptide repeat-containing protein [Microbispora rosea]
MLLAAFCEKGEDPTFGDARFRQTHFASIAKFGATKFLGDVYFVEARFDRGARFGAALFQGNVRFGHAQFGRDNYVVDARFGGAHFCRDVRFGDVKVSGSLILSHCQFDQGIHLGSFHVRDLNLDEAHYNAHVVVEATARRLTARKTVFQEGATLRLDGVEQCALDQAVLGGPSAIFGHPRCKVTSLRDTDLGQLVLADVDLSSCQFSGSHSLDKLRLEGRIKFGRTPSGLHLGMHWIPIWWWTRRQILAEEAAWRSQMSRKKAGWCDPRHSADKLVDLSAERLVTLYRSFRKAREDGKDEPGAADFYYGEMEMRRKANSTPWVERRIVLPLYWLVAGYGLRSSRALVALTALIAVGGLTLSRYGFAAKGHVYTADVKPLWDSFLYAVGCILSLDVKINNLSENLTRWGQGLRFLLRIAGPLFLGMAALAIRSRVKR